MPPSNGTGGVEPPSLPPKIPKRVPGTSKMFERTGSDKDHLGSPPGSPTSSPPQERGGKLVRQISVKSLDQDLGNARHALLGILYPNYGATARYLEHAISPEFDDEMKVLALEGFTLVERQKRSDELNRVHSDSEPKPRTLKAKSIKEPDRARIGRVVPEEKYASYFTKDTLLFAKPTTGKISKSAVYNYDFNGHIISLTDDRQDLGFIQTQIYSGKYVIQPGGLKLNVDEQGRVIGARIVIKDGSGEYFCIELNSDDLRKSSAMIPRVSSLRDIFEKKPRLAEQNDLDRLFSSNWFTSNRDSTARILAIDPRSAEQIKNETLEKNPAFVDEILNRKLTDSIDDKVIPHKRIACGGKSGLPIRGDVDLRTMLVRDDFPAMAFRMISAPRVRENRSAEEEKNATEVENLIYDLKELLTKLEKSGHAKKKCCWYIKEAIRRLTLPKENEDYIDPKSIIDHMATSISVLNAGLLIGMNSEILHGHDGYTPLMPERFSAEHIPTNDGKTHKATFGEFDFWTYFLLDDSALKGKLMEFNPCWFVAGDWRHAKNGQPDEIVCKDPHGQERKYNDKDDEPYSIEMAKLVFEKQFLLYKQKYPGEYNDMADVYIANMDNMRRISEKAGNKELANLQASGMLVAKAKLDSIRALTPTQVAARLHDIDHYFVGADGVNKIDALVTKEDHPGAAIIMTNKKGEIDNILRYKQVMKAAIDEKNGWDDSEGKRVGPHPGNN